MLYPIELGVLECRDFSGVWWTRKCAAWVLTWLLLVWFAILTISGGASTREMLLCCMTWVLMSGFWNLVFLVDPLLTRFDARFSYVRSFVGSQS